MTLLVPAIVCGLAVIALVVSEVRDDNKLHARAKPIASLAFLAVALLASDFDRPIDFAIITAQVFGVVGDLALIKSRTNKAWFVYGLLAFLVGHVCFIVGFCTVLSPLRWIHIAGWRLLGPIYVSIKTTRGIWSSLSATLKKLVPIYVAVITVMVMGALTLVTHGGYPGGGRLWWGAALFFISDVAVAQDLASEDNSNRVWGLPCYYAGQLLIAWSLAA